MKPIHRRYIVITLLILLTLACTFFNSSEPTPDAPPTQEIGAVTPEGESPQTPESEQPSGTEEAPPVIGEGGCTLRAAYVADITVPDDTEFSPEESFTKTWRIRNSGTCTWEEGTQLVFASGDPLGGPASVPVPQTAPNGAVDISVAMVAPKAEGTYKSNWQLQTEDGTRYGGIFYVQIIVTGEDGTAEPTAESSAISLPEDFKGAVASDCSEVVLSWDDGQGEGAYKLEGPSGLNVSLPADATSYTWANPPSGTVVVTLIALKEDDSEIGRVNATFEVACGSSSDDGTPDLRIESITFDPAPTAYLPVHVTVRVANSGDGDAGAFKLHWWGGKNFSDPSCEWTVAGGVAAGSAANMECDYTYSSAYGSITSKAQVDIDDAITESDEGNNNLEKATAVSKPVEVYNFVDEAPMALWRGGPPQTNLIWNGDPGDDTGFARWVTSGQLETGGAIQEKCLETHPRWINDGWIMGTYTDLYGSGYVVQEGDRFRATVGFLNGAGDGNVTYKVMIRPEGGGNTWIAEVNDTYGDGFKKIDVDLTPYAGKKADMILQVDAGADSSQDWACWLDAAIYRYP